MHIHWQIATQYLTTPHSANIILASATHQLPVEFQALQQAVDTAHSQQLKSISLPVGACWLIVEFIDISTSSTQQNEQLRRRGAARLEALKALKIESVSVLDLDNQNFELAYAEGLALANYQFLDLAPTAKASPLQKIALHQVSKMQLFDLETQVSATCIARDLVNLPLSHLNAEQLATRATTLGEQVGYQTEVLDKAQIEALGMGGVLGVNKGSFDPPTFSILSYTPEHAKNEKPIVLVGKGVVYDTGGMSLKPTANSMDFMKADMGGAAVVVGSIYAIAKAKLPVRVIGLIPATDNRPGKEAIVPGDVLHMMNGSTVEVMNTDAEGRLILADALHYAKRYQPELVLDFATLTGAAARAIGTDGVVYMGTAETATKKVFEASSHAVYERLVEFPLWDEYDDQLKSSVADLKNLGGPMGGAITAGKFLQHFTDYPWLHFDIAGPSFLHKKEHYRTEGGTGVGVRLVFDFMKRYYNL